MPLTAAVADVVAAVVVAAGAKDRRIAGSFVGMACCLTAWNALLGLESIPRFTTTNPGVAWLTLGLMVLPATVFHNAYVWSGGRIRRRPNLVWLGYLLAFFLCGLHTQRLIIERVVDRNWGAVGQAGSLYPLFVVFTVLWIGLAVLVCVRALKSPISPRTRLRVKYWLLGAAAAVPLGFTNFFTNYDVPIFPLGSLGNILMVGVIAYAAVRHHLMDIDRFIIRAGATVLASVAIVLPLAGAVIWMRHLPLAPAGSLVAGCLLLAAMVSLVVFSHFRAYIEQEVESSFFPIRRAAREAIGQLSAELLQLPQSQNLAARFGATLMAGVGLDGIALYFRTPKPGLFKLAGSQGCISAPRLVNRPVPLTPRDGTRPMLSARGHEAPGAHTSTGDATWDTCIPVRTDGTDLGFIALGQKRSGGAIDDSDITLLTMVAAQLAVALQNAEYVHQIERQKAEIEELERRAEAENVILRAEVHSTSQFREIIGSSPALQEALALVEKAAPTTASIVITGETGTGKELIARALHDLSPRRRGPLISVNCAAIPAGLAESELFGHERGAFTDAVEARPGKFELADGGTIFLDEIAELPLALQGKLLRVLQEHETTRVGGRKLRKLDLRVVAATNRDLQAEMQAKRFREDLYYRLATFTVPVPALRERTSDIPMLASYFLERAAATYQKPIAGFTADALAALCRYSWPGNIRELQNVVERAVLLCTSHSIKLQHLSDLAVTQPGRQSLGKAIRQEKRLRVEQALAQAGGNQAAAARLLGISRSNFARLLKSLGMKSPASLQ
ncbi:MAG: sigma 54-interacting transcriptional regulator [Candidatus Binatia bacterium]